MGKSRDLSEFERGMIVGARKAGCSISQTAILLGFSRTSVSRVYREWSEKQKTSSERSSTGRKRLVDENGEKKLEGMMKANSQATIVEIQALYNSSGPEKPISIRTTRRILKKLGHRRRAGQQDVLMIAGLEALAKCASDPEQLATSTSGPEQLATSTSGPEQLATFTSDSESTDQKDLDPKSQSCSSTGWVDIENENDLDT
ncbi:uncharacterized protein KZ484_006111 [Pholidichthys leucotaenia]